MSDQTRSRTDIEREQARLQEILDLDLLNREWSERLQDLVQRASEDLKLPTALVSLVLDGAQYFAASHGLGGWLEAANGTPVEWAFCKFAVEDKEPFMVQDATTHAKVKDNPLVKIDGVRCYLGIPLITSRGLAVGTLCVLGGEEREFSDEDKARMHQLAAQVVARVEARAGRGPVA
jgi:GAF domain-containing protein